MVRNNNRSLRSRDVAAHIKPQIAANLAYPVKQIQVAIKEKFDVDITYSKAWSARRKAIENIHGTWWSNFEELTDYMLTLQQSNPGTVVQFRTDPHSPHDMQIFKYVFWAFGPYIESFKHCMPVISIDGTHLKGPYKGKLLIAVTKNANNFIMPLVYAMVDEETNESWEWFLRLFRYYVTLIEVHPKLCVISDRHRGIINAMENVDGWKEPQAYHRFCLRQVRSNMASRFKSSSVKKLCWAIGSTTHRRKYFNSILELQSLCPGAWEYLEGIDKHKWTLTYDSGNRRWGNLTTNISESLNNVLRGARLLPIRAMVNYTFERDVAQYVRHSKIAKGCDTPLPPRMWKLFNNRYNRAGEHRVYLFNDQEQIYRVVSKLQTNKDGGNDYTVYYKSQKCSCRKWQTEHFPCSHAIAVCHWRGDGTDSIVNEKYRISCYRKQYANGFYPLPHREEWADARWKVHGNPSLLTVKRGRRRARRFQNEMDERDPEERPTRKCGICREPGHMRNKCPNRQ